MLNVPTPIQVKLMQRFITPQLIIRI